MNQSCHDFESEINFLSELSPSEISWDEHRATAEDMAVYTIVTLSLQNMQTELTVVQAI